MVRTDLGELKWMEHEATDYSKSELLGREVYIREGCSYCHSQYGASGYRETRRWGPVTQAGEYAFDRPHLFSTRRIDQIYPEWDLNTATNGTLLTFGILVC